MKKEYFLRELAYLLSDLTEEEREEALEYYRDYLEEAGPEQEEEILKRLGSPEKVAAEIRLGLQEEVSENGEFSERGYRDERFAEDNRVPDKYTEIVQSSSASGPDDGDGRHEGDFREGREQPGRDSRQEDWKRAGRAAAEEFWEQCKRWKNSGGGRQGWNSRGESGGNRQDWSSRGESGRSRQGWSSRGESGDPRQEKRKSRQEYREARYDKSHQTWKDDRRNGLMVLLLFVIFGIPLMGSVLSAGFSIVFGILGGIFGIFGGLISLVVAVAGAMIGLMASGIGMICSGFLNMGSPAIGTMSVCLGFLSMAAGVLMLWLVRWLAGSVVPGVFRFCIRAVQSCVNWGMNLIRNLCHRLSGRGGASE